MTISAYFRDILVLEEIVFSSLDEDLLQFGFAFKFSVIEVDDDGMIALGDMWLFSLV